MARPATSPPSTPGFDALVDRHQGELLRYVARTLGTAAADDEAQDVVQETFIRLHAQLHRRGLDSLGDPRTWLYRVAHNLAIDVGRRRSRRRRLTTEMTDATRRTSADPPPGPLAEVARREAAELALAQLEQLPEAQRQAIVLRVYHELTMQQIADVTGTTASNVCYRLTQGLATLARALRREGAV